VSTLETPTPDETSETDSRRKRRAWLQATFAIVNLVAICSVLIANNWERREKARQREQFDQQSKHIQEQIKELKLQIEKLKLARKAKQSAPGATKPPERAPQSGKLSPSSSP
jgi:small-conductance mechanosensitive channel